MSEITRTQDQLDEAAASREEVEAFWRDDDYYIADDSEEPRRFTRDEFRDFARRRALFVASVVVFSIALAVRIGFNLYLGDYPIRPESRDAYEYDQAAQSLLDGRGYARAWAFTDDRGETVVEYRASMFRPPAYPIVLALTYALTDRNPLGARIFLSTVGALTCVVVFLLGRRVFSHKVGFLAGVVSAVYPFLWMPDGALLPESLYALILYFLILRLYQYRDDPQLRRTMITGATAGALALTRSEGMVFTAMAAITLWIFLGPDLRRRLGAIVCVTGISVAIYLPWGYHNWKNFGTLAPSSQVGLLMAGNSNRAAYYDRIYMGSWYYGGLQSDRDIFYRIRDPRENEKTVDDIYGAQGVNYMVTHLERLPVVVGARVLRGWDLWDPYTTARVEEVWSRPMWGTYVGLAVYYPALVLAAYGYWRFRRNWRDLFPFYAVVAIFFLVTMAAYGSTRFRVWVEPSIVLFATATVYGLTSARFLERAAPLRELLERIHEDPPPEPVEIPERMERAARLRALKVQRMRQMTAEERALLPEGEELEGDLLSEATEYTEYPMDWDDDSPGISAIDEDGTIRIVVNDSADTTEVRDRDLD